MCLFPPAYHRRLALRGRRDIVTGDWKYLKEREIRMEFGTINGETRRTVLDIHTLSTLSTRREKNIGYMI